LSESWQEAVTRDVPGFSRFLETIGVNSGEELIIEAIASASGVKASTGRNYLDILLETLLASEVQPFTATKKRKAISRTKLWLFDVAVANTLAQRQSFSKGSDAFGHAFEHFIVREVETYLPYRRSRQTLCYWRTTDQKEVDLILPGEIACEIQSTDRVTEQHLKHLVCLREEKLFPRLAIMDGIEIVPWKNFLEDLWAGKVTS
jgi:predicted AAA+ superfamily ATPase